MPTRHQSEYRGADGRRSLAAVAFGWILVYMGLAMAGPNGLRSNLVWPTVSQHMLQAQAWIGEDIHLPDANGGPDEVISVSPRLDVTPYFRHRVIRDGREHTLVSNLAVGIPDETGRLVPAQTALNEGAGKNDLLSRAVCHVGFPPGPAALLAPLRLVLGAAAASQWLAAILGGIGVAAVVALRRRWARRQGYSQLSEPAFVVLAGAGTLWLWMVPDGGTFLFAQVVGTTFATLALALAAAGRPTLSGLAFAMAVTSRPATLGMTPLVLAFLVENDGFRRHWLGSVVRWSMGPAIAGIAALAANFARFGSIWEFGYRFMIIPPFLAERIHNHGSLSLAYLFHNLSTVLIAPPALVVADSGGPAFPYLVSAREGMGLLFVSPALAVGMVVGLLAIRRHQNHMKWLVLSLALTILPGLLYYNSGWVQWGGRFLMDAWPLWLLLAWEGLRRLPVGWTWALIGLSVASNLWAVGLTIARVWPGCVP